MRDAFLGPAAVWWLGVAVFFGALLSIGAQALWRWLRRKPPPPVPEPHPEPGHYVVRWHSEHGEALLYEGRDARSARGAYLHAEPWRVLGVPKGGAVELWDGPNRRGLREVMG
jgi:hypothetical protein